MDEGRKEGRKEGQSQLKLPQFFVGKKTLYLIGTHVLYLTYSFEEPNSASVALNSSAARRRKWRICEGGRTARASDLE